MRTEKIHDKSFTNHQYDIELYSLLAKLNEKYTEKAELFNLQKEIILKTLHEEGFDVNFINNDHHFVIPPESSSFFLTLNWSLLSLSPYKIVQFLNYQFNNYLIHFPKKRDDFYNYIEHTAYQFVESNNYNDEVDRLKEISNWLLIQGEKTKTSKSVKIPLNESKELDILKVQIQFLHSAFSQFEFFEKQKNAVEYEGAEQYISTLDNIDSGKIKLNIASLLIDYSPSKIYSFLKSSINIDSDQIKRVKEVSDEMTKKIDSKYPELDPRIRLAERLYKKYNEVLHAVECIKSDENTKKQEPKEYKSIVRARAFYLMLLKENGIIGNDILESKKKIEERIKDDFKEEVPKVSGKTVYERLKTKKDNIYFNYEDMILKYPEDYEYGLKLYKQKYPD